MNHMKRVIVAALACIITAGSSACGAAQGAGRLEVALETTEIRVFSNLPDRTEGQGLVEQMIFDAYTQKNPHITIAVEALDDEAYKIKFKAYASGTDMPELVSVWGQPGFIAEIIEAGLLQELHEPDYAAYGFMEGSLDGFRSADGRLYGLPRNTDVAGIYYNKAIFEQYGWAVPRSFEELLALCATAREAGLAPIAIDGADKWPLSLFYHDLFAKYMGGGTAQLYASALSGGGFSLTPAFLKTAELFADNAALLFQNGFETQGYGTARNLFAGGKAAMYYTGSWQMSMANDKTITPEMRGNIRVFTMPPVEGGAGAGEIAAWNGGGHSVTASGRQKEEAIKLLNYMYLPENWSRIAWENNACMSAQDFARYKTGNETPVQLQFIDIVQRAAGISGTPLNDCGTALFKSHCENLTQALATSMVTPGQFVADLAG